MMKTYTVLMPEGRQPALTAVVDAILRGFELAVQSSSAYKWRNLNMYSETCARWFDTDSVNAMTALKLELSNIGVQVEPQLTMVQNPDDWDIYVERVNSRLTPAE